jgi:hypothetical protein
MTTSSAFVTQLNSYHANVRSSTTGNVFPQLHQIPLRRKTRTLEGGVHSASVKQRRRARNEGNMPDMVRCRS